MTHLPTPHPLQMNPRGGPAHTPHFTDGETKAQPHRSAAPSGTSNPTAQVTYPQGSLSPEWHLSLLPHHPYQALSALYS